MRIILSAMQLQPGDVRARTANEGAQLRGGQLVRRHIRVDELSIKQLSTDEAVPPLTGDDHDSMLVANQRHPSHTRRLGVVRSALRGTLAKPRHQTDAGSDQCSETAPLGRLAH